MLQRSNLLKWGRAAKVQVQHSAEGHVELKERADEGKGITA